MPILKPRAPTNLRMEVRVKATGEVKRTSYVAAAPKKPVQQQSLPDSATPSTTTKSSATEARVKADRAEHASNVVTTHRRLVQKKLLSESIHTSATEELSTTSKSSATEARVKADRAKHASNVVTTTRRRLVQKKLLSESVHTSATKSSATSKSSSIAERVKAEGRAKHASNVAAARMKLAQKKSLSDSVHTSATKSSTTAKSSATEARAKVEGQVKPQKLVQRNPLSDSVKPHTTVGPTPVTASATKHVVKTDPVKGCPAPLVKEPLTSAKPTPKRADPLRPAPAGVKKQKAPKRNPFFKAVYASKRRSANITKNDIKALSGPAAASRGFMTLSSLKTVKSSDQGYKPPPRPRQLLEPVTPRCRIFDNRDVAREVARHQVMANFVDQTSDLMDIDEDPVVAVDNNIKQTSTEVQSPTEVDDFDVEMIKAFEECDASSETAVSVEREQAEPQSSSDTQVVEEEEEPDYLTIAANEVFAEWDASSDTQVVEEEEEPDYLAIAANRVFAEWDASGDTQVDSEED